jgi:hypothetical protein
MNQSASQISTILTAAALPIAVIWTVDRLERAQVKDKRATLALTGFFSLIRQDLRAASTTALTPCFGSEAAPDNSSRSAA